MTARIFSRLRVMHDAHPYGECEDCHGRFVPDPTVTASPDHQIRQQFHDHECREENFGKVVKPSRKK
jgi:hypothetical protein